MRSEPGRRRPETVAAAVSERERCIIQRAASVAGVSTSKLIRVAALDRAREIALAALHHQHGDTEEERAAT